MSGTKSTQFFFSDWMSDEGVRACSLGARGLWMDLLCIAGSNEGDDHGFVLIAGKPPAVQQIARRLGATVDEVETLIRELEDNGVFSRDRRGVIYCRRMARTKKYRISGGKGGRENQTKNGDNREINGRYRRLEASDKQLNEKDNSVSLGEKPNLLSPYPLPDPIPESKKESFSEWDFLSDDGQVFISKNEIEAIERDLPELKNIRGAIRNAARSWASAENYPNPKVRKQRIIASLTELEAKSRERVESHKRRETIVEAAMTKKERAKERDWQKGAIP